MKGYPEKSSVVYWNRVAPYGVVRLVTLPAGSYWKELLSWTTSKVPVRRPLWRHIGAWRCCRRDRLRR